ncbi:MAG: nucleotidyltransferase [Clostridia bacterium]|nr:nucleotidyltransferase [Clostridia bacterium]
MKTALVIMAAGIGSRFGGGIKQLAPIGPNGEIIMDYSIHDAIAAGFNKIVFIIRKDIEEDFREVIGNRIEALCQRLGVEVAYVFQRLDDLPEGVALPAERKKPWGTGQAILTCRGTVKEPFGVINADDYYGREGFVKLHDFLAVGSDEPNAYCMVAFQLGKTLSENGGVARGVCQVNADSYLTDINETFNIVRTAEAAASGDLPLALDTPVSMNMWGLTPQFIEYLAEGFKAFFNTIAGNELKAEYLLPNYIGELLHRGVATVKVLHTPDQWFGVTYKEDKESVVNSMRALVEKGVYRADLYSDLLS